MDRRTPAPAQAAGGQQVHRRRRLHHHDRRRPERAHRLPLGRGPGILLPARGRDGAEGAGGRQGARHPDQGRGSVLPAAAGTALAPAQGRRRRPGDRAQAPRRREGRPALVLRGLQPPAVFRILRARGHREPVRRPARAFAATSVRAAAVHRWPQPAFPCRFCHRYSHSGHH